MDIQEKDLKNFTSLDSDVQELINAAIDVRKRAYCPYSNFAVGSAIRSKLDGKIFTGCNVENGAYGPSICAERSAIAKAVSEGHREFSAIAVVAYQEKYFTPPCGICRQVISEFITIDTDIPIYVAKPSPLRVFVTSIKKLLPHSFIPDNLKENADVQELINAAIDVRKRAYCRYSNFSVGSAIRSKKDGKIFTGCNVENGAYGPTICAERTAIVKAVSEGYREFSSIAVVAYQENCYTFPCGVCRQVISEFNPIGSDVIIYVAKPSPLRVFVTSINKILPHCYIFEEGVKERK